MSGVSIAERDYYRLLLGLEEIAATSAIGRVARQLLALIGASEAFVDLRRPGAQVAAFSQTITTDPMGSRGDNVLVLEGVRETVAATAHVRVRRPAIAVPKAQHRLIPTLKGVVKMEARDLLARDIWNLKKFTQAPPAALKKLIDLNKSMFPGAF